MSAIYPTSVASFTTKVNHIDAYDASHVNRLQEEVVALQQYIGTYPQGSQNNLVTRLGFLIATNGALAQSNGFPASTYEGQLIWRTDQITAYIFGNGNWNSLGQTLSNVIFSYCGVFPSSTGVETGGMVFASTLTPVAATTGYSFWGTRSITVNTSVNIFNTKFRKISGITSILAYANIWNQNSNGQAQVIINVGGLNGSANGTVGRTAPEWTFASVNVSGLANGTVYDVSINLSQGASATGASNTFLGSVIGITV